MLEDFLFEKIKKGFSKFCISDIVKVVVLWVWFNIAFSFFGASFLVVVLDVKIYF